MCRCWPLILLLIATTLAAEAVDRRFPPPASQRTPAIATNSQHRVRNNSLSLLYELLGEEQHVSKLLIIKRERKELHDLIKRISSGAHDDVKALEQIAKRDVTVNLKTSDLPPGEIAAREAESKATEKELLHGKGSEFEFKLLLSQAEAMNYGSNLAKVAASDEPDVTRRAQFTQLSEQLHGFYEDVLKLLRPRGEQMAH